MYKNKKTTIQTVIEYQDLPFGGHPQNEFGIRILKLYVLLWFYCVAVGIESYCNEFLLFPKTIDLKLVRKICDEVNLSKQLL